MNEMDIYAVEEITKTCHQFIGINLSGLIPVISGPICTDGFFWHSISNAHTFNRPVFTLHPSIQRTVIPLSDLSPFFSFHPAQPSYVYHGRRAVAYFEEEGL